MNEKVKEGEGEKRSGEEGCGGEGGRKEKWSGGEEGRATKLTSFVVFLNMCTHRSSPERRKTFSQCLSARILGQMKMEGCIWEEGSWTREEGHVALTVCGGAEKE